MAKCEAQGRGMDPEVPALLSLPWLVLSPVKSEAKWNVAFCKVSSVLSFTYIKGLIAFPRIDRLLRLVTLWLEGSSSARI